MVTIVNNKNPVIYGYCVSDEEMEIEVALQKLIDNGVYMMDIRKIIDHFMLNYSPGDMVSMEKVVEELKQLSFNLYLTNGGEDDYDDD